MAMRLRLTIAALAAAGLASAAAAHEYKLGDLTIGHPYAIETAATAKTGAGYLSITNAGSAPDRLLAVEAGFPRVELHATEVDAAGVARMAPVEGLEIGPGETVTLAPQGTHVNVEPRDGAAAMDHEGMQH
jgi:copper(I)-binding protein